MKDTIQEEAKKNKSTKYISTAYSVCCQGKLLWIVFSCASAGGQERGWSEFPLFSPPHLYWIMNNTTDPSSSRCLLTNAVPRFFCWNSGSSSASYSDLAWKQDPDIGLYRPSVCVRLAFFPLPLVISSYISTFVYVNSIDSYHWMLIRNFGSFRFMLLRTSMEVSSGLLAQVKK